ncbi:hypothetical protein J7K50_09105 [bacterium]|nr:hypothetical protein [bacterium]
MGKGKNSRSPKRDTGKTAVARVESRTVQDDMVRSGEGSTSAEQRILIARMAAANSTKIEGYDVSSKALEEARQEISERKSEERRS